MKLYTSTLVSLFTLMGLVASTPKPERHAVGFKSENENGPTSVRIPEPGSGLERFDIFHGEAPGAPPYFTAIGEK